MDYQDAKQDFEQQMAEDGMRYASPDEDGWWDYYFSDEGERVNVWVTDGAE